MLSTHSVKLLGLELPCDGRIKYPEHGPLVTLYVQADSGKISLIQRAYDVARVFIKHRLSKDLPAWGSEGFEEHYKDYFEDYDKYEELEAALAIIVEPFEDWVRKKKQIAEAKATAAAGSVEQLKAIMRGNEMVQDIFRTRVASLEEAGNVQE